MAAEAWLRLRLNFTRCSRALRGTPHSSSPTTRASAEPRAAVADAVHLLFPPSLYLYPSVALLSSPLLSSPLQGLRARVANLDAQLVALQSLGPAGTGADGSGARRRAGKGGAGAGTGGADDSEDEEEGGAGGRGGGFPLWQLLLIAVLMLGVGFALARTGLV